jgi:hypothetical protein
VSSDGVRCSFDLPDDLLGLDRLRPRATTVRLQRGIHQRSMSMSRCRFDTCTRTRRRISVDVNALTLEPTRALTVCACVCACPCTARHSAAHTMVHDERGVGQIASRGRSRGTVGVLSEYSSVLMGYSTALARTRSTPSGMSARSLAGTFDIQNQPAPYMCSSYLREYSEGLEPVWHPWMNDPGCMPLRALFNRRNRLPQRNENSE